jgi:hypothetical protein
MTTTNHTPGPWAVETAKRFIGDSEETYDSLCVTFSSPLRAKLICELGADTLPDNPHNAHLIAAAPKLLQVLKGLLPEFVDLYERFDPTGEIAVWDQWTQEALEVIAEAEGVK